MGLGYLDLPFQSIVLPYDDEETPVTLTGKKMLPIIEKDDGFIQNESLDILKNLDKKNQLSWNVLDQHQKEVETLLELISSPVHSLAMPFWIWTPEFNEKSRKYFQSKKEVKRGPFNLLVQNQKKYIDEINLILEKELAQRLTPYYKSSTFSIVDIMIASHLWGLYIVPEFQFKSEINDYLKLVKKETQFNYHRDFWL